jgi:GNAT superfamily N-acetyltransferase
MHFRWDWLRPVVAAPYVPTLGPVQPGILSAELFDAVVGIAGTDRFLPYDKGTRWAKKKDEQVIVKEIVHRPGLTMIPTFIRGRGLVQLYHYGESPPQLSELTQSCALFGAANGRVVWFQGTAEGASTRLLLKTLGDQDTRHCGDAMPLADCAVADTFSTFAEQLSGHGFGFLHQRIEAGLSDGPLLVRVEDRRVVGAIGPLGTLLDVAGTRMQLPQYFAVHPRYQRKGHGRALWRAAMAWGSEHGAQYQVLQAGSGSAAERLYIAEGLSTLGFVCSMGWGDRGERGRHVPVV